MQEPRKPTQRRGGTRPHPRAEVPNTKSYAQKKIAAKTPPESIIDNSMWTQIQAQIKQEQDEAAAEISSQPDLSSVIFKASTFGEATLDTPDVDDPRATNLTSLDSTDPGSGFLPPPPR